VRVVDDANTSEHSEAKQQTKPGRKLFFLLISGETLDQFRERAVATARETGFLKKKSNEGS